MSYFT